MRPVGFFRALSGVCSGTEIFFALRYNRWSRAVWHLALLSFLLSLVISVGELRRVSPRLDGMRLRLETEFGPGAVCSPDGILPVKEPERARRFEVGPGMLLAYLGGETKVDLSAGERRRAERGLLIAAPRFFAVAVFGDGEWIGRWQDPGSAGSFRCSDGELDPELSRRLASAQGQWETPAMQVSFSRLLPLLRNTLALGFFLMWFAVLFALAVLYTAIFTAVNRLFGGGRGSVLSPVEYWKIGIYAGFPAMLVAAAFPAFDLPFLTYSTVYMIGLVVYWMIAAARVSLGDSPTPPAAAEDDNENEQ